MRIFLLLFIFFFSLDGLADGPAESVPVELLVAPPPPKPVFVSPEPECILVEEKHFITQGGGGNMSPWVVMGWQQGIGFGGGGHIAPITTHLRVDMEFLCPPVINDKEER
jgi:hypothetical protein